MATTSYAWVSVTPSFLMNDLVTSGAQGRGAIAGLAKGGYASAWSIGSNDFIETRSVRDNGSPFASETNATSTTAGDQHDPAVAALRNGRAIVGFTDESADPGGDIRVRFLGKDGAPLGQDFAVTTGDNVDSHCDVAALDDGGFVVSWTRLFDESDYDLRAAVYNANGSVRTPLVVIDAATDKATTGSSVAGLADGSFVVAWSESELGGPADALRFQRYDANGVALDPTPTLIDDQYSPNDVQLLALQDGGFAVAYTFDRPSDGLNITLALYEADGSYRAVFLPVQYEFSGPQDRPSLTQLSNGFILVSWARQFEGDYQLFDPTGRRVGGNERMTDYTVEAEVAALSGGLVANLRSSNLVDDGLDQSMRSQIDELVRTITGDAHNETLDGDSLADHILGMAGNDRLNGFNGKDTLEGGGGADVLRGGGDKDLLIGNGGVDRYVYTDALQSRPGALADVVKGFVHLGDLIDVEGVDAKSAKAGDQAFHLITGAFSAEGELRVVQNGADAIVQFNTTGTDGAEMEIVIKDVAASELTAADFVL